VSYWQSNAFSVFGGMTDAADLKPPSGFIDVSAVKASDQTAQRAQTI